MACLATPELEGFKEEAVDLKNAYEKSNSIVKSFRFFGSRTVFQMIF